MIGDSMDEVLGILLAKDLLPQILEPAGERFNLRDLLRPIVVVPESASTKMRSLPLRPWTVVAPVWVESTLRTSDPKPSVRSSVSKNV